MSSVQQRWWLLGIGLLMAAMQVVLATRQCLWADEIFSLAVGTGHSLEHPAATADAARGDFVQAEHRVAARELQRYLEHDGNKANPIRVLRAVLLSDTSPPLYYLLLYGWTAVLGTSDFVVRLLSVALSITCLPLLASIARRSAGEASVLPTCFLFAISPLGIYYGTEARMYSLLLFCVLATVCTSLLLQQRGGGILLHALWIAASAAGFLTHYFFAFPWLVTTLFLYIRPGSFARKSLVTCSLLVGLLIAPWYLIAAKSFGAWRVTQGWLTLRPRGFSRLRATRNHFVQFFSSSGSGLWTQQRWSAAAAILVFAAVAAVGVWRLRLRMFVGNRLLIWLWFIAACAAPSILDTVQGTFAADSPRYALAALPAAYLLTGICISSLAVRAQIAALALIALAWAPPVGAIYRQRWRNLQPFRQIAGQIAANIGSSDVVLVHSIPSGVLGVARYVGSDRQIASWVGQLHQREVPASLHALTRDRSRIFFVRVHEVAEPAPEETWLREYSEIGWEKRVGAATVAEFRPKTGLTF